MTLRACAVALKIPDNAAYTALETLRRLGVEIARVERSDIHVIDDKGDAADFGERMQTDETIFNPNKHRLTVLDAIAPRAGELWVIMHEDAERVPRRYTGWRLADASGNPVGREVLHNAAQRLFVNPATEKAITAS